MSGFSLLDKSEVGDAVGVRIGQHADAGWETQLTFVTVQWFDKKMSLLAADGQDDMHYSR